MSENIKVAGGTLVVSRPVMKEVVDFRVGPCFGGKSGDEDLGNHVWIEWANGEPLCLTIEEWNMITNHVADLLERQGN